MTSQTFNNPPMTPDYEVVLPLLIEQLQRLARNTVEISEDIDIVSQLGLDSVKVLDLIMEVEDEFDISIPMNVLTEVHTVRDLANAITDLLPRK